MSGPRKAGLLVPHLPRRGVRNAGRFTAPAAPGVPTRNRHTRRPVPKHRAAAARKSKRRGHLRFSPLEGSPPRKQVLRPAFRTRMDFAACCMSRLASFLLTRPRSCKLLPGHALGPSARLPGLAHAPRHMGPARCGHRSPLPVTIRHSRRAPYRSGMAAVDQMRARRSIVLGTKSKRC